MRLRLPHAASDKSRAVGVCSDRSAIASHDRIVVRRITPQEKTAGGIIIPDTVQEKPMEGEVIAAGPGARNEHGALVPLDVKAGDRVLFGKWSGTEVKLDGEDFLIMKEGDLMGVIVDVLKAA
jgi:chaperonin GroES